MNLVEEDINAIREALAVLKEQEEKNSARVKHALDLYETLQASISEKKTILVQQCPRLKTIEKHRG